MQGVLEVEVSAVDVERVRTDQIEEADVHESISIDVRHQDSRPIIILVHVVVFSLLAAKKMVFETYSWIVQHISEPTEDSWRRSANTAEARQSRDD